MMETEQEEKGSPEHFVKQVQGDILNEDPLKMNGDINGSRSPLPSSDVPSPVTCSEDREETEAEAGESQTNGGLPVAENKVPSQENGDVSMDVDDEPVEDSEKMDTSEFNGEVEAAPQATVSDSCVSVSTNDCSVSDQQEKDSASAINDSDPQEAEPVNSNSSEEGKNDSSIRLCDDNKVQGVNAEENPEIDERPEDRSEEDGDIDSSKEEQSESRVEIKESSKSVNLDSSSKEMEDLAKISSHGSLEITLVKTPKALPDSKTVHKEEEGSSTVESNKEETQKTPVKSGEDDSVIEISPEKTPSKKKKSTPPTPPSVPPRRSSRNLNKKQSYADKDLYIEELDKKSDDDVEEVALEDPLADNSRRPTPKKNTIVVSDTKKLVEIAAGSKKSGKKEPTLVIIDTNSILSGKGPIPVGQASVPSLPQMSITPSLRQSSGFTMMPVPQPYSKQVKSIPAVSSHHVSLLPTSIAQAAPAPAPAPPPKPAVLPSLTDDMFVVEAPSFIVPYVYEKPPVTALKEFVKDLEKALKEQEKEEKKKKKEEKDKKDDKKEDDSSQDKEVEKEKSEDSISVDSAKVSEDAKPEEEKSKSGEESAEPTEKAEADSPMEVDSEKPPKEKEGSVKDKSEKSDKSDTDTDDEEKDSDTSSKKDSDDVEVVSETKKKSDSYFDGPLGKFFMQIGINLVQEHVQTDLLRNQKRKKEREGENCPQEVHMAISSLTKTLEFSKENNEPYKLDLKKCKLCNFKTESALVMAHHLETPHMRNYVYKCNFCTMEVRSPHDILFHMEAEHNVRGRLERAPAFHQCPNCPFEDNQKGKLSRHLLSCAKKYKPERNQEPSIDWEPPAKIPRVRGPRASGLGLGVYQPTIQPRPVVAPVGTSRLPSPSSAHSLLSRGRGRPPIYVNRSGGPPGADSRLQPKPLSSLRPGVVFRPSGPPNAQVLLPSSAYSMPNNPLYQVDNVPLPLPIALVPNPSPYAQSGGLGSGSGATAKLLQQPSISITPLPRQQPASSPAAPAGIPQGALAKPGRPPGMTGSKTTFVICEICDGYIKDLDQLRNHMQWIHKVKIHPKMIYNRPPLNCQKCQFRFFTDQGLERHLLGSHGLVTSSMQEAANKGKDGGRCPVCGRVYQWKLLNHVARDHSMSLKPAHLSYKCTVCTATFGMYKQFENHVYSAHSVVAKRVMEKKPSAQPSASTSSPSNQQSDSYQPLKPLKINDEITIIPQPARAKVKPSSAPPKANKV